MAVPKRVTLQREGGMRVGAGLPSVPRDAATIVLVRDGTAGLEAYMVRRAVRAAFAAGAFVFPGGTVTEGDRHADLAALCQGRDDADASARLGVPPGGLAFWIAAMRECFEEAGMLLAVDRTGAPLALSDPSLAARFRTHRRDRASPPSTTRARRRPGCGSTPPTPPGRCPGRDARTRHRAKSVGRRGPGARSDGPPLGPAARPSPKYRFGTRWPLTDRSVRIMPKGTGTRGGPGADS